MLDKTIQDWNSKAADLEIEGRAFINGRYQDAAEIVASQINAALECGRSPIDALAAQRPTIEKINRAIGSENVDAGHHRRLPSVLFTSTWTLERCSY